MTNIYDRVYRYYRPYQNETNRHDWIKYVDHLLDQGRKYYCRPDHEPSYTQISEEESNILSIFLFQDNSNAEKEDIILGNNSLLKCVETNINLDKEYQIKNIGNNVLNNIYSFFKAHIEDIFEQIEELNGE